MYYQSLEYMRTFFKFNNILEENFLIKKFGRDTETACSSGDQCGSWASRFLLYELLIAWMNIWEVFNNLRNTPLFLII